jgi:hypothetical protein
MAYLSQRTPSPLPREELTMDGMRPGGKEDKRHLQEQVAGVLDRILGWSPEVLALERTNRAMAEAAGGYWEASPAVPAATALGRAPLPAPLALRNHAARRFPP